MRKEEINVGKGRGMFRGKGGRVGARGNSGRSASRFLRTKEVEVEDMSLDDLEEIEVTSETSKELAPVNHVVEVAGLRMCVMSLRNRSWCPLVSRNTHMLKKHPHSCQDAWNDYNCLD